MSDQLLMTSLFSSCLQALAADNDLALQTFVLLTAAVFVCVHRIPKFGFLTIMFMFTKRYWEPYICNNVGVSSAFVCVNSLI